jgi:hypothetical protein
MEGCSLESGRKNEIALKAARVLKEIIKCSESKAEADAMAESLLNPEAIEVLKQLRGYLDLDNRSH